MFSHTLILLLLVVYATGNNLINIPEEKSFLAISESIQKVKEWCVLDYDFYFLTRLAFAQLYSFPDQRAGGPYKVTDGILNKVKVFCKDTCEDVENNLQTTIASVNMTQLDKPIYSTAIMALYISSLGPIPGSLNGQEQLYIKEINPASPANMFSDLASQLDPAYNCDKTMDILLMLDISQNYNWTIPNNFLSSVLPKSRIAMVSYANDADIVFVFGRYPELEFQFILQEIVKIPGSNNLQSAISIVIQSNIFYENNNIKVAVIMSRQNVTAGSGIQKSINQLRNQSIVIYSDIKEQFKSDYENIRSKPSCQHYIADETKRDYRDFRKVLESTYCKLLPERVLYRRQYFNPIVNNNTRYMKLITVSGDNRVKVEVNVSCAQVNVYVFLNSSNTRPNAGKFHYKAVATVNQTASIRTNEFTSVVDPYIGLESINPTNDTCYYNISIAAIPPPEVMSCGDTSIMPISDNILGDVRILNLNCSDISQGFTIEINVKCGVVETYVAVNNTYSKYGKHTYVDIAAVYQAGSINIEDFSPYNHYNIKLIARRVDCNDSQYQISIQPTLLPERVLYRRQYFNPIVNNNTRYMKLITVSGDNRVKVEVNVSCAQVNVYVFLNSSNTRPNAGKFHYKAVATVNQTASIRTNEFTSVVDPYIGLESINPTNDTCYYNISIAAIPPPEVMSCGDTSIMPISDNILGDVRILNLNCSDISQGFTIEINVKCGVVETYVAVNNTYSKYGKHTYVDIAAVYQAGSINIEDFSPYNHYNIKLIARRVDCNDSQYQISIQPTLPPRVLSCGDTIIKPITDDIRGDLTILGINPSNCTNTSDGFNVKINAKCGEVTAYITVNDSYPQNGNYKYKTVTCVKQAGSINVEELSPHDHYFITMIARRVHCTDSNYTISIQPIPPPQVVSCRDTIIKPIADDIKEDVRILEVNCSNCNNSNHGFNVEVNVKCGELTTYVTVNNTYPTDGKPTYKAIAAVNQVGSINVEEFSPHDRYYIKLIAKGVHCTESNYTVYIQPIPTPKILSCRDSIMKLITGDMQVDVGILADNCNKSNRGFKIKIYAECGEVTLYEAVNNTYPSEGKHNQKVVATSHQTVSINVEVFSPYDQHYISIKARRKYCSDSYYYIFIETMLSGATTWSNPQYGILCLVNLMLLML